MDVKKAIETRKSIRKYQDKEVSEDLIMKLIDAARLAPSGNNAQPSRFYIVNDEKTKNKLKQNQIFKQGFVYTAPVIIICCADPRAYTKHTEGSDNENKIRAIRDLPIASSFLVLRATELGLGTCFIGWIEKEKVKGVLDIPKDYIVLYAITVGFPDEEPKSRKRKNIDEIIIK